MIYTLTLNPAIDLNMQMKKEITVGGLNRSSNESLMWGGKGINVSQILHTMGLNSTALGFIGGYTGNALQEGLQKLGITTDFVVVQDGFTRINVKILADTETQFNGTGPKVSNDELGQLYSKIKKLQKGDYLVLSGTVPGNLPHDVYEKILALTDNRSVNCVVDAEKDLLVSALKYKPFLVKPNYNELCELINKSINSEYELQIAAEQLQNAGARNVLISLGGKGAYLLDEQGKRYRAESPTGKAVNTVGAGDSMVAGFIFGFLNYHNYESALRYGIACGSATAFSLGLGTNEKVMSLIEQVKIRALQ